MIVRPYSWFRERMKVVGKVLHHYILDEHDDLVEETGYAKWAQWIMANEEQTIIGLTRVGKWIVRTEFIGLDMSYGDEEKLVWESGVFESDDDPWAVGFRRYTSRNEAVLGHAEMIEEVRTRWN